MLTMADEDEDAALKKRLAELAADYDKNKPAGTAGGDGRRRDRRRGAVAIDNTVEVTDEVRHKVKQAIFCSLGPLSKAGKALIAELETDVHTVKDLQKFACAPGLSSPRLVH